jgi:hypothetical protein
MSSANDSLPPQARSRSLARLDAEIVHAETVRARWAARALELEAAGRDSSYVRGLQGVAEDRLAQLRRSRDVLLRGEAGHESGEPEHAP